MSPRDNIIYWRTIPSWLCSPLTNCRTVAYLLFFSLMKILPFSFLLRISAVRKRSKMIQKQVAQKNMLTIEGE